MKCIIQDGIVKRVSDNVASDLVRTGKATYTTKAEWRKTDPDYKNRKPKPKKEKKTDDLK